jgi:demethylmenaquinone methyltransferase/2-methoxy-6-polyprenyl-1,4-benzoquinol methylase
MTAQGDSPPERNAAPGTRPAGAQDEREAAARVQEMFSRIAPRYDFLNHFLSLSFDRVWRRRAAREFRRILGRPEARVLDVCCGTGDLALALARVATEEARKQGSREAGKSSGATIVGADFVHVMLVRAREKSFLGRGGIYPEDVGSRDIGPSARNEASAPEAKPPIYVEADALSLPFADASFDLVTAAFGFRNLANYRSGLEEVHRVLRPGGEVGILEFSEPQGALLGPLYRFYFTRILPRIGGAISGSGAAYSYLPSSVMKFPVEQELAALMQEAGFTGVTYRKWTRGIVALHTARRG